MAAQRTKASDKQSVGKKLIGQLKKRYPGGVPKVDHDVLHTMLFGICLEDVSHEQAVQSLARLEGSFHDLNEIRVSSITELNRSFSDVPSGETRAYFVRSVLHYVFEKFFAFDFEPLRRKTLEQATKQLNRIRGLSHFVRSFTLQQVLGSHLVPVDQSILKASVWLGFVPVGATVEQASDELKSAVRKADTPLFCHLLRCLAVDPKLAPQIDSLWSLPPEEGFDLMTASKRLDDLFAGRTQMPQKPSKQKAKPENGATTKSVNKKSPAKSSARKKPPAAAKTSKSVKKKVAKPATKTKRKVVKKK